MKYFDEKPYDPYGIKNFDTDCWYGECQKPREKRSTLCAGHRSQLRRTGQLEWIDTERAIQHSDTCAFDGCDRKYFSKGYCRTHYMQDYRGAELTPIKDKVAA